MMPIRFRYLCCYSTKVRTFSTTPPIGLSTLYLHIGPSGDCWTGSSIYAAKHLQPDYVKSILLPLDVDIECLLERLEAQPKTSQKIYDDGELPNCLLERLTKVD